MYNIILYTHILAASTWIGGAIILFGLGLYLMGDKDAQTKVYYHIGPFYGYFEACVLTVLLITGGYMLYENNLYTIMVDSSQELSQILYKKISLVAIIVISTIVHMFISLKAHGRDRTTFEKMISRATSMGIFLLNLGILWYAILLRNTL